MMAKRFYTTYVVICQDHELKAHGVQKKLYICSLIQNVYYSVQKRSAQIYAICCFKDMPQKDLHYFEP